MLSSPFPLTGLGRHLSECAVRSRTTTLYPATQLTELPAQIQLTPPVRPVDSAYITGRKDKCPCVCPIKRPPPSLGSCLLSVPRMSCLFSHLSQPQMFLLNSLVLMVKTNKTQNTSTAHFQHFHNLLTNPNPHS